MNLPEVVKYLIQTDKQPAFRFERIALTLLERKLAEKNIQLKTQFNVSDVSYKFDAFSPEGIETEKDPTLVEVKFVGSFHRAIVHTMLIALANSSSAVHRKYSFLLILSVRLTEIQKSTALKLVADKFPDFNLTIWGLDDLEPLFEKFSDFLTDVIPHLREKAIKNIVANSPSKDWREERAKLLEKVKLAFIQDDLTLFLGAGVSASAGLPAWNSLLSQLLVSLINKNLAPGVKINADQAVELASIIQELNGGSSPLLEARYVNAGLGDEFEEEVTKVLYRNISADTSSPLLDALKNLCMPCRGRQGIRAIVTYNFDDLLERTLSRARIQNRPIYKDVDMPAKEELGIFHVHGFLPSDSALFSGISESLLVFSEKNYHTLMKDPYFWSNLVQLNFFRENTCLLLGLSGSDPNLRRLLEIAKIKTKFSKHFIFLKRTRDESFTSTLVDRVDATVASSINAIHHTLQERSFDELGLKVIWYEDYDELPTLINNLATG